MFTKLLPLVRATGMITITIAIADNDDLKVCVIPKATPGKDAALAQPLMLKGSAIDLDAEFFNAINSFQSSRTSLVDQVAATTAIMEAATKAQSAKAVKAVSAKGKNLPPLSTDENPDVDLEENDDDAPDATGANASTSPPSKTQIAAEPASAGTDLASLLD